MIVTIIILWAALAAWCVWSVWPVHPLVGGPISILHTDGSWTHHTIMRVNSPTSITVSKPR